VETVEMGALKKHLFEELKQISDRKLTGDNLAVELERAKMINEYAKTYITASMAEIKMAELSVRPVGVINAERQLISDGKRNSLLKGSRHD